MLLEVALYEGLWKHGMLLYDVVSCEFQLFKVGCLRLGFILLSHELVEYWTSSLFASDLVRISSDILYVQSI